MSTSTNKNKYGVFAVIPAMLLFLTSALLSFLPCLAYLGEILEEASISTNIIISVLSVSVDSTYAAVHVLIWIFAITLLCRSASQSVMAWALAVIYQISWLLFILIRAFIEIIKGGIDFWMLIVLFASILNLIYLILMLLVSVDCIGKFKNPVFTKVWFLPAAFKAICSTLGMFTLFVTGLLMDEPFFGLFDEFDTSESVLILLIIFVLTLFLYLVDVSIPVLLGLWYKGVAKDTYSKETTANIA